MSTTRQKNSLKRVVILGMTLCVMFSGTLSGVGMPDANVVQIEAADIEQPDNEVETTRTYINNNINAQNYTYPVYKKVINSYLEPLADGYMRVQKCNTANVLVEYYDENFTYISNQILEGELPIFGGFYAGSDAYYLVWGKRNEKEYADSEVIRVVKYDKNWNRLTACSVYGANTTKPFHFGPVRMTECNGYLFLRTCHEMFKGYDSVNHQANMTLQIRQADMVLTDYSYDISNNRTGYASHCMNTFLLTDDTNHILTLDQGDGAPRGAMIGRYKNVPGDFCLTGSYTPLLTFAYKGEFGQNTTRATLGGFGYSDTSILVAGTSADQTSGTPMGTSQNLYLSVTDRKELEETEAEMIASMSTTTTLRWLTDFKEEDNEGDFHHSATTPHLLKWNNNLFLLIWSETEYDEPTGKLYYEFIDGSGKQIGKQYSEKGDISDCQPIIKDGKAVWYTTDNKTLCFYSIDRDGNLTKENVSFPQEVDVFPKPVKDCRLAITRIGDIKEKQIDSHVVVMYRGKVLKEDEDYVISGSGHSTIGGVLYRFSKTIQGCDDDFYGEHEFEVMPIRKNPRIKIVTTSSDGATVKWEQESGCMGYVIYRSADGKEKEKVADIVDSKVGSWTDREVEKGRYYSYSVKAYTKNGTKTMYTNSTETITVLQGDAKVLAKPRVKSLKWNMHSYKMTATVGKIKGADGYEYQFGPNYDFNVVYQKKSAKSNKTTIKLKEFCSYVRVRPYKVKGGKKLYGPWSEPYNDYKYR